MIEKLCEAISMSAASVTAAIADKSPLDAPQIPEKIVRNGCFHFHVMEAQKQF